MNIVDLFNGFEAAFWFALAVFAFCRFGRKASPTRRLAVSMAAWLLLFAISDVIEVFTGAWWRPLELLILKGACVCGLAYCGWQAFKLRPRSDSGSR